jgi:uncharacterized protein YndB with AHSA1/START domain
VFELNATVGGRYRMHFTNLGNGQRHAFGGIYQALVPFERIVHTDVFEDSNLPGEMRVTVTFKAVSCGTEVHIVQEGIPAVIPVEGCYLGWQQSLQLLSGGARCFKRRWRPAQAWAVALPPAGPPATCPRRSRSG